jgi:hypothetical protein
MESTLTIDRPLAIDSNGLGMRNHEGRIASAEPVEQKPESRVRPQQLHSKSEVAVVHKPVFLASALAKVEA